MQLTRSVAPVVRPVETGQVTEWLRVTDDAEQQLIDRLIDTTIAKLDGPGGTHGPGGILGRRCIMPQTWVAKYDGWPDPFFLPVEPVQSVVLRYIDTGGVQRTLDGSAYEVVQAFGEPPQLVPAWQTSWPGLGSARFPVEVTIVAGSAVPDPRIATAIMMWVAHAFENRLSVSDVRMEEVPDSVSALIDPLRRGVFA